MTIRFASANTAASAFVTMAHAADVTGLAANDNAPALTRSGHDDVLRDALKHFARHGLRAAEVARQNAERAFFADDRAAYRHWLDICRALDRRMAMACHARIEARRG
jgi:hypothetical protein